MDTSTVAIGDIVLVPLILSLVQFAKRFAPGADGRVWLASAFILGIVGQFVVFVLAHGSSLASVAEWDFTTWVYCIISGAWFALAAAKAYDELSDRTGPVGAAIRGLAGK